MSSIAPLQPLDEHNRKLQANVHPEDWVNPTPNADYQLVVIGAGTAGLVAAAGAAGLGARVALVERELMGGDCLNVGCVPSKGIISSARIAATVRESTNFGVTVANCKIDFAAVMERMRRLRADISPLDSAKRFRDLGVDVFLGQACFDGEGSVTVTHQDGARSELKFKKAVIATGARASAPPIPGLDSVVYLTNETVFSLTELPARLGIIGGGPIGAEMAQTFARLGSEVTLFENNSQILSREDPDAVAIIQKQLQRDGIKILSHSKNQRIDPASDSPIRVTGVAGENESYDLSFDQLLVAVGRAPNTDGLNLDSVSVEYDRRGVDVDDQMRTSNPKIFAAGDICSKFKFTHAADFQARIVVQNALFAVGPFGKKKASSLLIPWATYTSPEIAHVGIYERDAREAGIEIDTFTQSLEHNDRAILEGVNEGFVRVHVKKGTDKIVGATIVAENAGDMISELTLAMNNKVGLAQIGSTVHPYPTQAEAIRKLGDQYNKTKLTPFAAKVLGFLMKLNVGR